MRIRLINHSCVLLETASVRLICDPWIEGRVFLDGWDLLCETPFTYQDFADITHIWFSHEHPDHFYPPNVKRIPEEYRRQITVLYQQTADGRVAAFCRKQGFERVIEMPPNEPVTLAENCHAVCTHFGEGDSWLSFKAEGTHLLNINDCGFLTPLRCQEVIKAVGVPHVLLTQFSYAFWAGNPEDVALRRKLADEKLAMVANQVRWFQPQAVIPIASFVWFCHEENFYLNDEVNRPGKVLHYLGEECPGCECVLLYPNEGYELGQPHDSAASCQEYDEPYRRIQTGDRLARVRPVEEKQLRDNGEAVLARIAQATGRLRWLFRASHVYVTDLQKSFELSLSTGMRESPRTKERCDVLLSSECLDYIFGNPWGLDTVMISGRLRIPDRRRFSVFFNLFRPLQREMRGEKLDLAYLLGVVKRKILIRLGLLDTGGPLS